MNGTSSANTITVESFSGDSADVWIHIDTTEPTVKITRAVYGKGQEDGMLRPDGDAIGDDANLSQTSR